MIDNSTTTNNHHPYVSILKDLGGSPNFKPQFIYSKSPGWIDEANFTQNYKYDGEVAPGMVERKFMEIFD